ncbi:MAG: hypothetical protein WCO13_14605 [Bacteroidota bacterium]
MKKLIIVSSIFLIISISCKKEEIKNDVKIESITKATSHNKSTLPPIREFDCGAPAPSPYPCPNANCKYMGWDCAFEVDIHSRGEGLAYTEAANILDTYIVSGQTGDFFKNYPNEVKILMVEITTPERILMLDDLKNGVTTVRKHPVYSSEYEQEINVYQIYVVGTGKSPNYGDL